MQKAALVAVAVSILVLAVPTCIAQITPPNAMHICDDTGCLDLARAGDHYEGHKAGINGVYSLYWIDKWATDHVEFHGKTTFVVSENSPAVGTFTGKLSPGKDSIAGGMVNWHVGSASGTKPFTLSWELPGSNRKPATLQTGGAPKRMRLCTESKCDNMVWVGDHYEAHDDGDAKVTWKYQLVKWTPEHIEFVGRMEELVEGVAPLECVFTGRIAPDGESIADATYNWKIELFGKQGTRAYKLSWRQEDVRLGQLTNTQVSKAQEDILFSTPRRSSAHPNILLPPMADEKFAEYPADIRAVLQPSSPITPSQAKLACTSTETVAGEQAIEIAKFAYRAADYARGYCWLRRAMKTGDVSVRGRVLLAVSSLEGWGVDKNDNLAFMGFKPSNNDHDPWGMYFLAKCYSEGIGVAQDKVLGERVNTYLTFHGGEEVFKEIGSDDAEVMRIYRRGLAFMNPPTKSQSSCSDVPPAQYGQPGVVNGRRCSTTYVVDQDRLDQELQSIDNPQQ